MNDPNKRIDVNLSSLLSLKAELLRKHQEVNKAKITQQQQQPLSHPAASSSASRKSKRKDKKRDDSRPAKASNEPAATKSISLVDTYEETEMLLKSKQVLEAKSRFYDRMSRSGGSLNSDENCLVMFNHKKQSKDQQQQQRWEPHGSRHQERSKSSASDDDGDDDDDDDDADDDDWVEYTDCLGRTRKCLKADLAENRKRDEELAKSVSTPAPPTQEHSFAVPSPSKWFVDTSGSAAPSVIASSSSSEDEADGDNDDTQSMISKSSKADEMRSNWERQETENAGKESIHYQDVLFNEARSHGTGYYAFSTDSAERTKQQQDLESMRQKTLSAQTARDEVRRAREKIIADRVRAAQNRQRARAGLPPLEPDAAPAAQSAPAATTDAEPSATSTAAKAAVKAAAKEAKRARKLAAEAERRAAERQQHVRPWDHGKDGVRSSAAANAAGPESSSESEDSDTNSDGRKLPTEWSYKPDREPMSQEQWNQRQRAERRAEFAPIVDLPVDVTTAEEMLPSVRGFQSRSSSKRTAAPTSGNVGVSQRFNKPFVRRNQATEVTAAAEEEQSDVDYDIPAPPPVRNAEFAPPATFEYCGPSASKQARPTAAAHLESSIEAGLRFLRQQSDKDAASTKQKWASNASY